MSGLVVLPTVGSAGKTTKEAAMLDLFDPFIYDPGNLDPNLSPDPYDHIYDPGNLDPNLSPDPYDHIYDPGTDSETLSGE